MTKIKLKILLLAIVLIALPAQAQNLKDAYAGTKKSAFKKQFKHLAVMPLVVEPSLKMPDEFKQILIDEVLKKFTKSKYDLLALNKVKEIQDQLSSLYPADASADAKAVVAEHTLRELFYRHPVDGLIKVKVLAVAAPFLKDKAEWGGTSQKIKHKGDGFLGAIMGKDYGGHVAASAVQVTIFDRAGKPVYNWMGGIEVLMQRNGQKLEALPAGSFWQKPKKVLKAAKYAVKPI